jgi:hypothetical protein
MAGPLDLPAMFLKPRTRRAGGCRHLNYRRLDPNSAVPLEKYQRTIDRDHQLGLDLGSLTGQEKQKLTDEEKRNLVQ